MKYSLIALCVVAQLWTASAAPLPAIDSTPSSLPPLEQLLSEAQANIKSASEHLNEMIGLPKNADASSVLDVVKKNTENYAKDLSEVVEKIKKQVDSAKTGEVSETVKAIQEKLEKTVESLRKQTESPEAKQIQESFTKSLNTIVEQANKLSKSAIADQTLSEDLQKLSKQVIEQAVKAADTIQSDVHKATGHKEEHQHHKH